MDNIEQTLLIAEAQKNRSRKQGLLYAAAAVIVLALVFLAYQWGSRSAGSALETSHAPVLSDNEPAAASIPANTSAADNTSPEFLQAIDEYQEALSGLEGHQRFGEDATQAIEGLKQLRTQLEDHEFSRLEPYYEEALSNSKKLLDEVENFRLQLVSDIERAYEQRNENSFQAGIDAYDALGRNSDQIAQWRDLTEIAPELFPLLKEVEVHRVQNDPGKELAVLKQIQAMGFAGENIPRRVTELQQTLHRQAVSRKLQAAHELYADSQFQSAKTALNEVLKAEPSNANARQLLSAVDERLAQQEFKKLYSRATALAAGDRWLDASQTYSQALSIQPNHRQAREGLELANDITGLESEMQKLLAKPLHLGDKQVSEYAQNLRQKAKAYAAHSPKLTNTSDRLQESLVQMSTPSRIAITSDGKARIEVRGVGYIEPTTHKVIFLTPGIYQLYSHCKGHVVGKSQLEVPVNQPSVEVSVTCGRRI